MTNIELAELSEIKQALGQYLIEIRAIRNDINRMERNMQEIRDNQSQELAALGGDIAEDIFKLEKGVRENKKKHQTWQMNYRNTLRVLRS